jgi:hypothetical protein
MDRRSRKSVLAEERGGGSTGVSGQTRNSGEEGMAGAVDRGSRIAVKGDASDNARSPPSDQPARRLD